MSEKIDRLARRLARSEPELIRAPTPARALEIPMTRRRAVTLLGGAVVAGSLLRPGRAGAQNCYPGGPKTCTNSKGARVCVPNDLQCCSNDNCAIACPYPWRDCEAPANCADTARMCTDPTAPDYAKGRTKFCSQRIAVTNGCVAGGSSMSVRGWCCGATEECGTEFGSCECPESRKCSGDCCKQDEECVRLGLLQGRACAKKCPTNWHHDGYDCVCDKGSTCGVKCCPEGTVCEGSRCVKPREPDRMPSLWDAFTGFGDMANQSAGAHGGGPRSQLLAAQVTDAVASALLALAAVNAQGVAAGSAFADRPVDRAAYRRKVVAAKPSPPRISSGAGLEPSAARALEALLAAEAKGFALTLASGNALARARGATVRHDRRAARKQVLAAAGFAAAAARALRPVPSLRKRAVAALRSTGAVEVVASPAQVLALQADVRATGVPPALRNDLRRLGIRGSDLASVRAALLAASGGGPTLIEPLADPARTRNLQAIATELTRYSKAARRAPISRTRGRPKRFRPRANQEV